MIALKHFQLLRGIFYGYQRSNFSNLIKQTPLSFEDLVSKSGNSLKKKENNHCKSDKQRYQYTLKDQKKVVKLNSLQFSALQLMSQSIAEKKSMKTHPQPTFQDSFNLSKQERDDYSIEFMKYLEGSLSRTQAISIIAQIEKYSNSIQRKVIKSSFKPLMAESKNHASKQQRQFFKRLREKLIQELNYYSENVEINNNLIQELFKLLPKAQLSYITVQNFERECPQMQGQTRGINTVVTDYIAEMCSHKTKKFSHQNDQEEINYQKRTDSQITQSMKSKKALQDALKLNDKTKLSKLHIKKQCFEDKTVHKEYQYKMANDKIVFQKIVPNIETFSSNILEADERSAYIYELPFNFGETETTQFIDFLKQQKDIKVQSYFLFPYKSFLQRNFFEIIYRVPQNYNDNKLGTGMQRILKVDNIDKYLLKSGKKQQYTKITKKAKSKFDDVPLQNEPAKIRSVTDALLLKIKKENYSKFNKSSMVIRFASKQDKEKVLNKQSRLYGLNYKNFKNIKFQEGYSKRIVSLTGFPWGCYSKELQVYLNNILQPLKIPISCPEDCVMTKNYVLLQFEHLSQALIAISRLNNTLFQNKTLKAQLSYGPLKLFRGQYIKNQDDSSANLKKKIAQCGILEQAKFVGLKNKEEELSKLPQKQISKGKKSSQI